MVLNKKAVDAALTAIVVVVVLLVVAYIIIHYSSKGITDAGDEFSNLLNQYTANCDHDFDGLKDKEDVCPCNNDDFFGSRIYYIADNIDCSVNTRCIFDSKIEKIIECEGKIPQGSQLTDETDLFEYYINLKSNDACKKWYNSKGKEAISKYSEECASSKVDGDLVAFNHACALKLLAMHKVTQVPTFMCKMPTKECKEVLKKEC